MKIKDRLNLKIESVAFGGEGVGRADGFVVFVPFTTVDDVVDVEIVQRKKTFARGRLLEILTPSPFRADPVCPYFGRCGGCAYQHIQYEHQLEIKRKQVEDAFGKIAKIAVPKIASVIGSPQTYAYRGKATLHAEKTAGGLKLGFMDISGGNITDIKRCWIMHESINDQIRQWRDGAAISSPQEDVTFWSGHRQSSDETVIRRVKDREFAVPYDGFFQANLFLTDRMVDEVLNLVEPGRVETLVDACCGCGLFSVFLAPHARRLIGVEIYEKSVHYARVNAANMGLSNVEFVCSDVNIFLREMARKKEAVDLMVLDPPRTGLDPKTLAAISEIKPSDIIYISCNPATQARDVRGLQDAGYELRYLQLLDMFPQTQHIETIGLLGRNPSI